MTGQGIAATVVVLVTLVTATAAAAQDGERFTLGGGAGISQPFHGDFDFHAASWEVAGRGRAAEHLTIEGFAAAWRHSRETVSIGLPLQGPNGRIGTIGELTQRTTNQTLAFGVSLLPTVAAGRLTVTLGGGANVMFFQRRFDQQIEDCQSSTPVPCDGFTNSHTAADLGAHLVGGVDVRIAPRLTAFGQYRVLVPVSDPGSGHAAAVAGVRLTVR